MIKNLNKWFTPQFPFLLLFLGMFLLDQKIYMYGDDFRYATYYSLFPHFYGNDFSISQIIQNQIYDYNHVNGRFFTNIFSILMLVNGINVWRILNPFILTLFCYLIFYSVLVRLPKKGDEKAGFVLVSLFFLVHLYISRQTLFYAVGSFNYVYPMVGLFLLIIFFRRMDDGKPYQSKIIIFLFWILAFFLGWSQEQVAVLTIGFIVFWIGKEWICKKNFQRLTVSFLLFGFVGFLGLFLSPGVSARASSHAIAFYNQLSLIGKLKMTFPAMVRFFIHQQAIFTILLVVLLSALCYQISSKWYWLISGPIVLLPFVFDTPLFGQANILHSLLMNRVYLSLYGMILICIILVMSGYLAIQMKNYLFLMFPFGFLFINIATIFTPSLTGGRVAFPAIPLAMASIILLFDAIKKQGMKVQLVLFLLSSALFNYYYLYTQYHMNAVIHKKRQTIMGEHAKIKRDTLILPRLINRGAAGYELDDQEYVIRGFKDYYHINQKVIIRLK
jgi:hypothetical protein